MAPSDTPSMSDLMDQGLDEASVLLILELQKQDAQEEFQEQSSRDGRIAFALYQREIQESTAIVSLLL